MITLSYRSKSPRQLSSRRPISAPDNREVFTHIYLFSMGPAVASSSGRDKNYNATNKQSEALGVFLNASDDYS